MRTVLLPLILASCARDASSRPRGADFLFAAGEKAVATPPPLTRPQSVEARADQLNRILTLGVAAGTAFWTAWFVAQLYELT